ncbi:hypothetical protein BGZ81_008016 [Podila clonocystis]|nr:hypothetical protein BGZ81_008016 [Podila clonocystis]
MFSSRVVQTRISVSTYSVFSAAAVMLLATVQAAPAFCPTCDEAPPCGLYCPGGYCEIDWCYCRPFCQKGDIP